MPNVPALIGRSIAAAMTVLQNASLTLGNVTVAASPIVQAGNVVSVSPPAGTLLAAGSPVDLAISKGSKSWKDLLADSYQSITFNVIAVLLLAFLGTQLGTRGGEFLTQLANQDIARGLITFLITATAAALFV